MNALAQFNSAQLERSGGAGSSVVGTTDSRRQCEKQLIERGHALR
jgi:hypothetical protein